MRRLRGPRGRPLFLVEEGSHRVRGVSIGSIYVVYIVYIVYVQIQILFAFNDAVDLCSPRVKSTTWAWVITPWIVNAI